MEGCPAPPCLSPWPVTGLACFLPEARLHLASLGEVCRGPGLVTPLAGAGGPGERQVPGSSLAFPSSSGQLRQGRAQEGGHLL